MHIFRTARDLMLSPPNRGPMVSRPEQSDDTRSCVDDTRQYIGTFVSILNTSARYLASACCDDRVVRACYRRTAARTCVSYTYM
jgi:hypothetical protein